MKTTLKIFLFLVVALGFSATAMAQTSTTASATILTPITVTKVTDLNFGNVVPSGVAGTIQLSTAAVRTPSGGASVAASNVGTVSVAEFNLAGETGATFNITLPSSVTLNGPSSSTMTVNNFTSTPSSPGTLTGGAANVKVGATLNVGINQTVGTYSSASFNVTFAYN